MFRDLCNAFGDLTMTQENIGKAGIELYGAKVNCIPHFL